MVVKTLKSPFNWFGSKPKVADIIWKAFGQVANYVEPFAGSLAVLLGNPSPAKIETVNDLDAALTNFWRAVSSDMETTAHYAEYPVSQLDLHARHRYIIQQLTPDFIEQLRYDPQFFDAKLAGYWLYGIGASIGNNWLQPKGLNAMPLLSSAGGGIHGLSRDVKEWLVEIQQRTKRVRIVCGDWKKVLTPATTFNNVGLSPHDFTAVYLDPPYSFNTRDKVYREDQDIFPEVYQWVITNGNHPRMRIALSGYQDDQFPFPEDWQYYAWKTGGGYSGLGNGEGKDNASRERIWFSPNCLKI